MTAKRTAESLFASGTPAMLEGCYSGDKLLYERGGMDLAKLSEEQQVEVEEDYQTCVRAMQRAAGGEVTEKKKSGRRVVNMRGSVTAARGMVKSESQIARSRARWGGSRAG